MDIVANRKVKLAETAKKYFSMGYAVVPLAGKRAQLLGWQKCAHPGYAAPEGTDPIWLDEAALSQQFSANWADGVAILTGWNSGNIIVVDLESAEIAAAVMSHQLLDGTLLGEKLSRCPRSCTPGGGAHIFIRLSFPAPTKSKPASGVDAEGKTEVLIEILAQGQCAAEPVDAAGDSNGRRWEQPLVPVSQLEQFSRDEFDTLLAILTEFDAVPAEAPKPQGSFAGSNGVIGNARPYEEFNNDPVNRDRVINGLITAGWKVSKSKPPGGGVYLAAPHRTESDVSASFGVHRNGEAWYLRNFSTSVVDFPQKAISVFDAVAILEFGGDQGKLLATLRGHGGTTSPSKPAAPKRRLVTVSLGDSKPKPVNWIVTCDGPHSGGMFAAGLTLIVGEPGAGKSTFMRSIAARFMRRTPPPMIKQPGSVLYMAWEDCKESMMIPAFIAERADYRLAHMVSGIDAGGGKIEPWSAKNIDLVRDWLRDHPEVKLVVVDTLETLMATAGRDSNKAGDARAILDPLHQIGLELGIAVVVLHHTNKRTEGSAQSRISGSVQIAGAARQVYMLAMDRDEPDLRHIARDKSNLPKSGKGFCFRLVDVSPEEAERNAAEVGETLPPELVHGLQRIQVVERDRVLTADELFRKPTQEKVGKPTERAAFIAKQLQEHGPIPTLDMIEKAKAANLLPQDALPTSSSWTRAKGTAEELHNVKSRREGDAWVLYIDKPAATAEPATAAAV